MDEAAEQYVMLLLADSNLPTGSFVASAGFESYVKHGFFYSNDAMSSSSPESNQSIVDFVHSSLENYARSALPFVSDTHSIFSAFVDSSVDDSSVRTVLRRLNELDNLYHSMTLNEVTRRASKSQGVALLTLYSKGFSKPLLSQRNESSGNLDSENNISRLVDRLKLNIRREDMYGHLPICWGVLTAALKLSLEKAQRLHLFLQARTLLSSAIRLNTIGPYAAQQILLHVVKGLVDDQMERCKELRTGLVFSDDPNDGDGEVDDGLAGAVNSWPLGEIVAARHDLQHSRIFNS